MKVIHHQPLKRSLRIEGHWLESVSWVTSRRVSHWGSGAGRVIHTACSVSSVNLNFCIWRFE